MLLISKFIITDDLIVDPRNLEWMREANCPVVSTLIIIMFASLYFFHSDMLIKSMMLRFNIHAPYLYFMYVAWSVSSTFKEFPCWDIIDVNVTSYFRRFILVVCFVGFVGFQFHSCLSSCTFYSFYCLLNLSIILICGLKRYFSLSSGRRLEY